MKSCETSAFFRVQTLATIFEKSQHCISSWQWSYVFRPADREQSWLLHLINILHVCVCFLLPLYEGEGRVDASCRYYCVIHLRRPALIDMILVRILFSVNGLFPWLHMHTPHGFHYVSLSTVFIVSFTGRATALTYPITTVQYRILLDGHVVGMIGRLQVGI